MAGRYALIADIGATNARFAVADSAGVRESFVLSCAEYPGIVEAAEGYLRREGLEGAGRPRVAAFAVAAPIEGDSVRFTNNPWSFSIRETQLALGFDSLRVMNDFEALALAVPYLGTGDLLQIGGKQKAVPQEPIGIVGPGTGLGVASLAWDGERYITAAAGAGGHVGMPVRNAREFAVLDFLQREEPFVSAEMVCSGIGLANLYRAVRILDGREDLPEDHTPKQIVQDGLTGRCPVCVAALDLMAGFLGVVAGDLALTMTARGGIYIGGGVAVKLQAYWQDSSFRREFEAKGRLSEYLRAIPTWLITHPFPAFVGLKAELERRGLL